MSSSSKKVAMIVSAIVAVANNHVIGKDNQIPWHLPADLKYFKKTTLHHHVIMGRKSFRSIGRPLPKRINIVLTRDPFWVATGVKVLHDIEAALHFAHENGEQEAFIIGGGQIYEQSQDYWDRVYLTKVKTEVAGEVFFPALDPKEWKLRSEEAYKKDEKNEYDYTFCVYERIEKLVK